MREFEKASPAGDAGEGIPTPDGRPTRNLRSRPWAGIRACASGVSPSHEPPMIRRRAQWHVDTPQQTLTVAGAAQELRRLQSIGTHLFPVWPRQRNSIGAPENVAGFYPIGMYR